MDDLPPASLRQSLWHGARLGLKWTTYIVGPIAAVLLLLGVGLTAFDTIFMDGVSALTKDDTAAMLFGPFGMYLSSCLWGAVIGMTWAAVKFARQPNENTSPSAHQ